jgi:uncharacterized RDD family membrane protein YckC
MTDAPQLGIVTPEAVLLDLPAAGIATRMGAEAIDLFCQLVLFVAGVMLAAFAFPSLGSTVAEVVLVIWAFAVLIVAPIVSEGLWNGRTPGKALLRLRVVTLDGGPELWRHSFIRGICQVVDIYLMLGIFPALATRRSQRFGDLLAGTFVLVEPRVSIGAVPIAFYPPPGWEQYVSMLDVGRIRPDQYRLIRSFLLRVGEFEPGARWHLSVRLSDAVWTRVSPSPGPAVPPELFLVCVASAYQHRNGGLPARP